MVALSFWYVLWCENALLLYLLLLSCVCSFTAPMMVTIEFKPPSVTVNESDGSVTVNLLRTGNNSDNFTVCINVTMIVDPAIAQRMCILYIAYA